MCKIATVTKQVETYIGSKRDRLQTVCGQLHALIT